MNASLQAASVVAMLILGSSCFGQGTILFYNLVPAAGIDAPVFDAGGSRLEGGNYGAILYAGLTQDSLEPVFPAAPFLTGTLAGYFNDLTSPIRSAANVPRGALAWAQVRAWDARLGGSYEQVAALGIGGFGESNPFQIVAGGVGAPPSPPAYLLGLQSFSLLLEVPEPSAVVLLLLGLPLLLLRKRHFE